MESNAKIEIEANKLNNAISMVIDIIFENNKKLKYDKAYNLSFKFRKKQHSIDMLDMSIVDN